MRKKLNHIIKCKYEKGENNDNYILCFFKQFKGKLNQINMHTRNVILNFQNNRHLEKA